jgi:hypothetical protein
MVVLDIHTISSNNLQISIADTTHSPRSATRVLGAEGSSRSQRRKERKLSGSVVVDPTLAGRGGDAFALLLLRDGVGALGS